MTLCWLDEFWASQISRYKFLLHLFKKFDHVIVSMHGSLEPLEKALGRTCHWVPLGIDTIRFSTYPAAPERVIDVLSVGRRSEVIHRELLKLSSSGKFFYVYDTIDDIASSNTLNPREHRDYHANMAKRSIFFMVAPALRNAFEYTHGQIEVGYRYYEGLAAGAILWGRCPIAILSAECLIGRMRLLRSSPTGLTLLV